MTGSEDLAGQIIDVEIVGASLNSLTGAIARSIQRGRRLSQIWEPRDAALLPVICGPNHKNLLLLETELSDGDLKAESQGGGIRAGRLR